MINLKLLQAIYNGVLSNQILIQQKQQAHAIHTNLQRIPICKRTTAIHEASTYRARLQD